MRFDEVSLEKRIFFSYFFQVCPFVIANFNKKKYRTSYNILIILILGSRRGLVGSVLAY